MPLIPGKRTSRIKQPVWLRRGDSRNSSAEAKVSITKPAAFNTLPSASRRGASSSTIAMMAVLVIVWFNGIVQSPTRGKRLTDGRLTTQGFEYHPALGGEECSLAKCGPELLSHSDEMS